VVQRESECAYAQKVFNRIENLFERDHVAEDRLDQVRAALEASEAMCVAARAKVTEAAAAIAAAEARVERLQADLDDATLVTPRSGQVLYRLAEPGEVLSGGGKVVTIIDLDDIYMTVFLPTKEVGRVRIGAEARLVLDALPERPVGAVVSFVASKAQFTPRQVETAEEREKLMFRVKVKALENPDRLLKPGMPGVAYIRQFDAGPWPEALQMSRTERIDDDG
jgi:HlyD family secretion protein